MLYFSNQKPRFFRRGFLTTIIYLLSVSCTAEASVAVSQKVEQVLDFRGGGEFLFHFFYGFVEFQARAEEEAVGFLEALLTSAEMLFLAMPTLFKPTTLAGLPSAMTKGHTS